MNDNAQMMRADLALIETVRAQADERMAHPERTYLPCDEDLALATFAMVREMWDWHRAGTTVRGLPSPAAPQVAGGAPEQMWRTVDAYNAVEAERNAARAELEEVRRHHAAEFAHRCGDLQRDLEVARNAHAALMAAITPREEELRALRAELEKLKAPTPAAPGVNEEGLLPCPFCGATDGIEKFDHGHGRFQYYVCGGCDAYGPEGNTPEGAKSTWNRRALSLPAAPSEAKP